MTLILTKISSDYVLQVSDRLVTTNSQKYDEKANKNIIFGATNALVTIGYTGFAYIGKLPTDQWIAEKISRQLLVREGNLPWSRFLPPGIPWFDLENFIIDLKNQLDNVLYKDTPMRRKQEWINWLFDVSIAGWQWNSNGDYIPVFISLSKPPGVIIFKISIHHSRNLARNKYLISVSPLSNLPKNERVKLRHFMRNTHNIAESEELMIKTIQNISVNNPLVGSNCMSISIQSPATPKISIKYSSLKEENESLSEFDGELFPVAYSPWLVTPRLIQAPSLMTGGGWNINLGMYQVNIYSPLKQKSESFLTKSQPRKKYI